MMFYRFYVETLSWKPGLNPLTTIRTNIGVKKFQTKIEEDEWNLQENDSPPYHPLKKNKRFLIYLNTLLFPADCKRRRETVGKDAAEATCVALIFLLDYPGCVCWLVGVLAGGRRRAEEWVAWKAELAWDARGALPHIISSPRCPLFTAALVPRCAAANPSFMGRLPGLSLRGGCSVSFKKEHKDLAQRLKEAPLTPSCPTPS